jgi:hypothetical protein
MDNGLGIFSKLDVLTKVVLAQATYDELLKADDGSQ